MSAMRKEKREQIGSEDEKGLEEEWRRHRLESKRKAAFSQDDKKSRERAVFFSINLQS